MNCQHADMLDWDGEFDLIMKDMHERGNDCCSGEVSLPGAIVLKMKISFLTSLRIVSSRSSEVKCPHGVDRNQFFDDKAR